MRNFAILRNLLLAFILCFLPAHAQALLSEEESAALERGLKIYQKSKTPLELVERLRPWLDLDSYLFAKRKAQSSGRNSPLPKIHVINGSRVTFKIKTSSYTVDFISARSDLLAINRREVEFQPDEAPETRFKRILTALTRKTAALRPFSQFWNPPAFADDSNSLTDDQAKRTGHNLTHLALMIDVVTRSVKTESLCQQGSPSKSKPKIASKPFEQCNLSYRQLMLPDNQDLTNTGLMKGLPMGGTLVPDATECPEDRLQAVQYLSPDQVDSYGGRGPKESNDFAYLLSAESSNQYSAERVNEINKKKGDLEMTIKAKLQGLRDQVLAYRKMSEDQSKYYCSSHLNSCLLKLLERVRQRTNNPDLACFADKIRRDVSENTKGAPPASPKAPPAQPANR